MICMYQPQIPTIIGPGAIKELGKAIANMGKRKPMLVYGKGTKAAGIIEKAEASLKRSGLDYYAFDHTTPDPTTDLIQEIKTAAWEGPCDCIVGIGGGSNMDAAKAASFMFRIQDKLEDILTDKPQFFDACLPVILVPTTSGSGSEASNASVIENSKTGIKVPCLVNSTLAIVDPELTCSVPPHATAYTGMDAFAHAAEAILSSKATPRAEVMAHAAIRNIIKYLPEAVKDGNNIEARTAMSYASNWAGFSTLDASPHLGHAMSEAYIFAKPLPHGLPCAWSIPSAISYLALVKPDKAGLIGEAMGLDLKDESPETAGVIIADEVRAFMRKIGIKTPKDYDIKKEDILNNPQLKAVHFLGCPVEVSDEDGIRLMADSYDNY